MHARDMFSGIQLPNAEPGGVSLCRAVRRLGWGSTGERVVEVPSCLWWCVRVLELRLDVLSVCRG